MNAAERLELIRSKCRPVRIGPVQKRRGGLILRAEGATAYGIGPRLSKPDRVVEWVAQPEDRAKEWQPEHRHGAHALTRIAEKLKRGWQK